ncbi:MAG: hypothetical protein OHK0053_01040 [Microscillaceae bacterium]
MKKNLSTYQAEPIEPELEGKAFRIVCLVINLFLVYVILNDIILGSLEITYWIDSLAFILVSFFNLYAWFSPYRRGIALAYFLILLIVGVLSWFTLGGLRGPNAFNFLGIAAISVLAIQKPHFYVFAALLYGTMLTLTFIEVSYLHWINRALAPSTQFSMPISYVLVAAIILVTLVYLKGQYDAERQFILSQNKRLADNNQLIAAQNEELKQQQEEIEKINLLLEEKVRNRTSVLELKNRQLAEFAYLNAHKLRGPLARILGLINVLNLGNFLNHDQRHYLQLMRFSSEELDKIIKVINQKLEEEIE